MAKLKWGVGTAVTCVVVIVGGNLYADKSLQTYYQQDASKQKNLNLTYQKFEMGTLKGSADWTAEWTMDPCQPTNIIKLSGQDQIRRSWNGYSIQSEIKIVQAPKILQSILKEPLKAKSKVNWLGNMHISMVTPMIVRNDANIQSKLEPMTFQIRAKPQGAELKIIDLKFEIPNLTVTEKNSYLHMAGFKLDTNQGLNGEYLEAGKSQIQIDSLKMSNRDPKYRIDSEIKNLRMKTQSVLTDRVLNTEMQLHLDEMKMPFVPMMQKVQLNFNVMDINRQKLQALFDLLEKGEKSCVVQEKMLKDMEPALLAVINEGFRFEAKNNQVAIGTGTAKANMTGRIMPSHQSTAVGMLKMMPSLMEYKADMEFDKNIVANLMNGYSAKAGTTLTDADIEKILSTMQQAGQLEREGDRLKMSVEYKFGEKKFLN